MILWVGGGVVHLNGRLDGPYEKGLLDRESKIEIMVIDCCPASYTKEMRRVRTQRRNFGNFREGGHRCLNFWRFSIKASILASSSKARGKNKVFNYGAVIFVPGKARRMRIAKAT